MLSGGAGTHPSFFSCRNRSKTRLRSCTYPVQRLYGLVDGSHCWFRAPRGALFSEERFTDLNFADDAVIFAEYMQSLVESLTALNQESGSLGFRVSWIKNKIQNFLHSVDQVSAVTCCGEAVDVVEVFHYLGSQITPDGISDRDVLYNVHRRLGLTWGAMSALGRRV